jgi:hypothetical protein
VADSEERGGLDDLYNQGLLTDDEHRHAVERITAHDETDDSERHDSGRRQMPRLMRFWPIVALLVGIGLIIFAIVGTGGGGTSKQPGLEVDGAVVISHGENGAAPNDTSVQPGASFGAGGFNVGQGCHTISGFIDIASGASVQITDASGKTLVRTALKAGVFDQNADCVFGFTAAVPKVSGYSIKIAQRNPVSYSQAEIGRPQLIL